MNGTCKYLQSLPNYMSVLKEGDKIKLNVEGTVYEGNYTGKNELLGWLLWVDLNGEIRRFRILDITHVNEKIISH